MLLIVLVSVVVQDTNNNDPIENCCDLGFKTSVFGEITNKPKQYRMKSFCRNSRWTITKVYCDTITKVYCDTITNEGRWIVVQRRVDGSVNFNRDWVNYEHGFGTLPVNDEDTNGEFWIGLYSLYCLTNQGQWELRIDYTFPNDTNGYLSYSNVRVGPVSEQYPLTISGYSGATTDPFSSHDRLNGMKFTTRDRDNDRWSGNCATYYQDNGTRGGWWYNSCAPILPTHSYKNRYTVLLNGQWHSLAFIEMKIRPKNCNNI